MRKKTITKRKTIAKKNYKTPAGFKLVKKKGKRINTRYSGRYNDEKGVYIYVLKGRKGR